MVKSDWNIIGIITIVLMAALIACTTFELVQCIDDSMPYTSRANITMDVVGLCICLVLFVSTFLDRRTSAGTLHYMTMLTLECILLFWDFEAWYIDGDTRLVMFNGLVNYYIYCFVLLIMISFWFYVRNIIRIKDRLLDRLEIVYYIAFICGFAYIISNVWTGWIFSVSSETGLYSREDGYAYTLLAPFVMVVLNFFITWKYINGGRKKMALYSYTFMPILAAAVSSFVEGLDILYISLLFSLMLIYGNFYVERGHELVRKRAKILERKVTIMVAQIQPRFLFNALESIQNIEGNPDETKKAIAEFSSYLRGNLDTLNNEGTIPFDTEMRHVETYVELEKLRFKEKLSVVYDVRDRDFQIPALTLQMLMENAIKHGVTQREEGGTVRLTTEETDDAHVITVTDDGVGFDTTQPPKDEGRSHVGIANVMKRVSDLVSGTLVIESEIGKGTKATVTIPKNIQKAIRK